MTRFARMNDAEVKFRLREPFVCKHDGCMDWDGKRVTCADCGRFWVFYPEDDLIRKSEVHFLIEEGLTVEESRKKVRNHA